MDLKWHAIHIYTASFVQIAQWFSSHVIRCQQATPCLHYTQLQALQNALSYIHKHFKSCFNGFISISL